MADQAYADAINAFSATLAPLTDPDDIAAALTGLDNAFAGIRARLKAVAQVASLAAAAAVAQQAATEAIAAHAAAVALAGDDAPAGSA